MKKCITRESSGRPNLGDDFPVVPDQRRFDEFLNADDTALLEAFMRLLPSEDDVFRFASEERPAKFVRKLHDIGSSSRTIVSAVTDYAGAKLMRMRYKQRRLSPNRIKLVDHNLLSIFDCENDALDDSQFPPGKEKERGRQLYNLCEARAEQLQMQGFILDPSVAKGELHCLANGEGYEHREISWKQ